MAKFYGEVGYGIMEETSSGIYEETIVTRNYYGDAIKEIRRLTNSGQVNDDLIISNNISIVSDPYANENYYAIRYVEYMGVKWKAVMAEVVYPRVVITLGELYNG